MATNEFEGAKIRYYAVNGDVRGLTFNEMIVLKIIAEDDTTDLKGANKMECAEESGLPMMAVNESLRSLLAKGRITSTPQGAGAVMTMETPVAAPSAEIYSQTKIPVSAVNKELNPPEILVPRSLSNGDIPPEIAAAITNASSSGDQMVAIDSHAKKDANNVMNLMDGLSTGRLMDHINEKADFSGAMKDVGGGMGTMMEGLSLKMPSVPLDGTLPGKENEKE